MLRLAIVALAVYALQLAPAGAQQPPARFEVATLKVVPPPADPTAPISVNLGTFRNGRFTFGNVTMNDALIYAFDLSSKAQLVGMDWEDSVRFNVEALAPEDTPRPVIQAMVRDLLEERLLLKTHREQRTLRHIALVVAPGGPKFREATGPAAGTPQFPGRINHKRMPMSLLASLLSRFAHELVVDQTGLAGFYEIALEWGPDLNVAPLDPSVPPPDQPGLYTAVREQLGLRLEGRRAPLEVIVVESATKTPTDN
jgi:uncharacterized protein (TIGR03435 family)